jgi:hypothetical protein
MRKLLSLPDLATPARKGGGALPRDPQGPVFKEDWQAHAVAMVMALYNDGHYDWSQWDDYLGPEIKSPDYFGGPAPEIAGTPEGANRNAFLAACEDDGAAYYHFWLAAMENLLDDIGLVSKAELEARAAEIGRAEGEAPRFRRGDKVRIVEDGHDHGHSHIPGYLHDVVGTIEEDRGLFVLPEAVPGRGGHHHGEQPLYQRIYAVAFAADEIWPGQRHTLNFSLWDHQLRGA